MVTDGHGEFVDVYEITPHGIGQVSEWLRDNWNPHDIEDCAACVTVAEGGDQELCPPHYGYALAYKRAWEQAAANSKPDQQDDWQECAFLDIRKGDRVRLEFINGDELTLTVLVKHEDWFGSDRFNVERDVKGLRSFYRIPGPKYPDPAEHPVIIIQNADNICWMARPAYWDSGQQEYVFQDATCTSFAPSEITEWEPASIVPKVVADE